MIREHTRYTLQCDACCLETPSARMISRAAILRASTRPHRRLWQWLGKRWSVDIELDPTALFVGISWQADPVGYQTALDLTVRVVLLQGVVVRFFRESSYWTYERAGLEQCRCCTCCQPVPCAGALYGAQCDAFGCRRDESEDEDELPF